jgi:hypothetical protein
MKRIGFALDHLIISVRIFHTLKYLNEWNEEFRLLGRKNPVRTSEETQYVSAREFNRLMLCKTRGFHRGWI